MKVVRRTFEAAKYPKGSPERARLNEDARTSEYLPSRRYVTSDGETHVLKRDAEAYAACAPPTGCRIHPTLANPFCRTCRAHATGPIDPLGDAERAYDREHGATTRTKSGGTEPK